MTMTDEKIYKIKMQCRNILSRDDVSIKELAKLIRNLVGNISAVTLGTLHYRHLEIRKIEALKGDRNNLRQ